MNGIKSWSFKDKKTADGFDSHVREQLPWYDLATKAVAFVARNYLSDGGIIYDIGASTGNISLAIDDLVKERQASLFAIEESEEMAKNYRGNGRLIVGDALLQEYRPFDVGIFFLTFMFLPIGVRADFLKGLIEKMNHGGAIIMVEKTNPPSGYAGSVIRRLTMNWKLLAGAKPEEIIQKDLTLCGVQRPVSLSELGNAKEFFRIGEFSGWIIEKND